MTLRQWIDTAVTADQVPARVVVEAAHLIGSGLPIQAIRYVKDEMGWDLTTARGWVIELRDSIHDDTPGTRLTGNDRS